MKIIKDALAGTLESSDVMSGLVHPASQEFGWS